MYTVTDHCVLHFPGLKIMFDLVKLASAGLFFAAHVISLTVVIAHYNQQISQCLAPSC